MGNIIITVIKLMFYEFIFSDFFEVIYKKNLEYHFNKFKKHPIKNKIILITEPSCSHGEVIPGLVKYCLDLNYKVDILLTNKIFAEKPLEMFKYNKNVQVFNFGLEQYKLALHSKVINKYNYIIFSSSRVYYDYNLYKERFVLDYINNTIPANKIILIEHHLNLLEDTNKQKYKISALPEFCTNNDLTMINPHYFGKTKIHKKNRIVKFITAGSIEKARKNHNLLIDAVEKLLTKNIDNFEIIVVGDGNLDIENIAIKNKIKCTGRVSYQNLYKYVQNSDYILPLLDSNNPKHYRYIKDGTSGTFQLCYGFLKPMIINEYFAKVHGFSDKNAIIYTENNLAEKMEYALNQSEKEYNEMIENIKILEKSIYQKSLKNMESYIGKVRK